eukprot:6823940-Pyramimonas_sp.AAC.1
MLSRRLFPFSSFRSWRVSEASSWPRDRPRARTEERRSSTAVDHIAGLRAGLTPRLQTNSTVAE